MAMPREKEYYTVSEAADRLHVSPVTIWRWIEEGRLAAYRVGPRSIRIMRDDLEGLVQPVQPRRKRLTKEKALREDKERDDIWKGYDPAKVAEVLAKTAGSWADLDADALIADLYRAREQGSRPAGRP